MNHYHLMTFHKSTSEIQGKTDTLLNISQKNIKPQSFKPLYDHYVGRRVFIQFLQFFCEIPELVHSARTYEEKNE